MLDLFLGTISDKNKMRAKFRLHRTMDDANLSTKRHVVKVLHHLSSWEISQRTTLLAGWACRFGPGLVGERLDELFGLDAILRLAEPPQRILVDLHFQLFAFGVGIGTGEKDVGGLGHACVWLAGVFAKDVVQKSETKCCSHSNDGLPGGNGGKGGHRRYQEGNQDDKSVHPSMQ